MSYVVVKAGNAQEAIQNSPVQVGDYVKVTRLVVSDAGLGQYSVSADLDFSNSIKKGATDEEEKAST